MTVIGEAFIDVRANTDRFDKEAESGIGGALTRVGGKVATTLGVAFAGAGVAAGGFFLKAISGASDLAETISKVGVVFGDTQRQVVADAEFMASKFGIPKQAFLDASASIGLIGKASGIAQDDLGQFSTGLARLAVDASSFYNVPLEEALMAIQSGLVGEAEPMRRFGVLLNEQAVSAEAARLGLEQVNGEYTEGAKAQARASLIMAGMKDATGDLERTQGSLANRLRELRGRLENFASTVGSAVLPMILGLMDAGENLGGRLVPVFSRIGDAISGLFDLFVNRDFTGALARAFGIEEDSPIVGHLLTIRDAVANVFGFIADNAGPVLGGLAAAIVGVVVPALVSWAAAQFAAIAPILALGAAIALLVGGLIYAWQNFETFRDIVTTVVTVVTAVVGGFVGLVTGLWRTFGDEILGIASAVWSQIQLVVETAITIVQNVINLVLALIRGDWSAAWDAVKSILGAAWGFIQGTVQNAMGIVGNLISAALGLIQGWWDNTWGRLVSIVADMLGRAREAVGRGVDGIVGFVAELPGRILGALGDVGSMLYNAGLAIMRGLRDGIVAGFRAVADFVGGIAGRIADLKGPLDYDKRLLVPAGHAIMEGLERALAQRQAMLDRRVRAITAQIAQINDVGAGGLPPGAISGATAAANATALPPALLAEIRALVAAVQAMADARSSGTWNVHGTDPVAVAAVMERRMDWRAGR